MLLLSDQSGTPPGERYRFRPDLRLDAGVGNARITSALGSDKKWERVAPFVAEIFRNSLRINAPEGLQTLFAVRESGFQFCSRFCSCLNASKNIKLQQHSMSKMQPFRRGNRLHSQQ